MTTAIGTIEYQTALRIHSASVWENIKNRWIIARIARKNWSDDMKTLVVNLLPVPEPGKQHALGKLLQS